jgi:hypothetical protein
MINFELINRKCLKPQQVQSGECSNVGVGRAVRLTSYDIYEL